MAPYDSPVVLSFYSQCSHTLMSASYVRPMMTHVEEGGGAPMQLAVANGTLCTALGTCRIRLKLQQSTADLSCHVLELTDAYDVILGEDSLSKCSATMSCRHKRCVLTKGSQRITSVPGCDRQGSVLVSVRLSSSHMLK